MAAARDRLPALQHCGGSTPRCKDLAALAGPACPRRGSPTGHSAKADDFATLIYTSGTTGRPKGCQLTHGNLLSDARNAFMGPRPRSTPSGRFTLLFLPLAHTFGRIVEVGREPACILGHCSDIKDLLAELASFQPTFILAVPRVFEKVSAAPSRRHR